jgi:hypothetical protein
MRRPKNKGPAVGPLAVFHAPSVHPLRRSWVRSPHRPLETVFHAPSVHPLRPHIEDAINPRLQTRFPRPVRSPPAPMGLGLERVRQIDRFPRPVRSPPAPPSFQVLCQPSPPSRSASGASGSLSEAPIIGHLPYEPRRCSNLASCRPSLAGGRTHSSNPRDFRKSGLAFLFGASADIQGPLPSPDSSPCEADTAVRWARFGNGGHASIR